MVTVGNIGETTESPPKPRSVNKGKEGTHPARGK